VEKNDVNTKYEHHFSRKAEHQAERYSKASQTDYEK